MKETRFGRVRQNEARRGQVRPTAGRARAAAARPCTASRIGRALFAFRAFPPCYRLEAGSITNAGQRERGACRSRPARPCGAGRPCWRWTCGGRQHRKGVPGLHLGGVDIIELNALLVTGVGAVVNVEEISGHSAPSPFEKLRRVPVRQVQVGRVELACFLQGLSIFNDQGPARPGQGIGHS